MRLEPGEIIPPGPRSEKKASDREIVARALFEEAKAGLSEMAELEWEALPEGGYHPMKGRGYWTEQAWVPVESLWRAGRLT